MLVFHSHCQLGNKMFIYACARSLAKKRGLKYCLSDNQELTQVFKLSKQDGFTNTLRYLTFRIKNKILSTSYKYFHFQDNSKDYLESMNNEKSKDAWYYGYFQGEKYFSENRKDIRDVFTIKSEFQKQYNSLISKFPSTKKTIVIHIRLRDYKTFGPDYLNGPDMRLPFSYYHQLLSSYPLEDYHVIFTSDEIERVKKEFQHVKQAYFSENHAMIDFQFIKNADVAIISHSTFAWWAAWLNENPNKTIIVPKYFLGFKIKKEYPIDIIPEPWTKAVVI